MISSMKKSRPSKACLISLGVLTKISTGKGRGIKSCEMAHDRSLLEAVAFITTSKSTSLSCVGAPYAYDPKRMILAGRSVRAMRRTAFGRVSYTGRSQPVGTMEASRNRVRFGRLGAGMDIVYLYHDYTLSGVL